MNLSDITSVTTRGTSIDHTSVMNVAKDLYITKISLDICHATQDKDRFNVPFQIVTRRIQEKIILIAMCATIMPLIRMRQWLKTVHLNQQDHLRQNKERRLNSTRLLILDLDLHLLEILVMILWLSKHANLHRATGNDP